MWEKAFNLEYGVAGLCVLLTLLILVNVGKFFWEIKKEKDKLSDSSIVSLTNAVKELQATVSDLPKFRTDVRRFYAALKHVSGDRWPAIRDEILKDDFIL